jgi:2-oxoisovalerate dehydrogenase E1 component
MPKLTDLAPAAGLVRLDTTPSDWQEAQADLLQALFMELVMIRTFEERVLALAAEDLINGPAHSSIGQEAGAVGSVAALKAGDQINGSHRGHHQFLAKAMRHVEPEGLDLRSGIQPAVQEVLVRSLAEICGLARGYCKGRGGSMHLMWREAGAMGTNAIVGGGVPQAAGFAWADLHSGSDNVSVTYFGDGAVNIGSVLESMNLASAWKLPICFFIENNQYAVSTRVEEATGEPRLAARGMGFSIPSWQVDGMDPLAVYIATQQAVEHMRAGLGPTIIEAEVYRFFHQNGPFPGSAFGYRSKEEEATWRARDPLNLLEKWLLERGILTEDEIKLCVSAARDAMQSAEDVILEADPQNPRKRRIKLEEWPDPSFVDVGIRGDLSEFAGVRYEELETFTGQLGEGKFVDAIARVLARRMETDSGVVVLGEDVHRLNGGTNGATRGLADRFPNRVLGTPISENAFVGVAGGLALDGRFTPVVELMYADFVWVAADQVFNQIAKARHMFGGESDVPVVIRGKTAMGTGYGSQHSMDPAGIYATAPGFRIAAPSTPFDYVGMMNSALLCKDPVLVIEHVALYGSTGEIPESDLDYFIPIGKAAIRRRGNDVTIITYLSMVNESIKAVDAVGSVDAEVIDLRWLDRASVDWECIEGSIKRTGNALIVEQGAVGTGYGAWLADEIQRRYFDWLDGPVMRVTGAVSSPSISQVLEKAALASALDVERALRALAL